MSRRRLDNFLCLHKKADGRLRRLDVVRVPFCNGLAGFGIFHSHNPSRHRQQIHLPYWKLPHVLLAWSGSVIFLRMLQVR